MRLFHILQTTFGLEKTDIVLKKYKNLALLFEFSKDGSEYLFCWVNRKIQFLELLYFYKEMLGAFDERYFVDTRYARPIYRYCIREITFLGDYFRASLYRSNGSNIGTFKNNEYSVLINRYSIKGKEKQMPTTSTDMWNGFAETRVGGGSRTQRRKRGVKYRTRRTIRKSL